MIPDNCANKSPCVHAPLPDVCVWGACQIKFRSESTSQKAHGRSALISHIHMSTLGEISSDKSRIHTSHSRGNFFRRKGAISKSVKKCQDKFRHFFFRQFLVQSKKAGQNRQFLKVSKTCFSTHFVGHQFASPLWGASKILVFGQGYVCTFKAPMPVKNQESSPVWTGTVDQRKRANSRWFREVPRTKAKKRGVLEAPPKSLAH